MRVASYAIADEACEARNLYLFANSHCQPPTIFQDFVAKGFRISKTVHGPQKSGSVTDIGRNLVTRKYSPGTSDISSKPIGDCLS